MSCVSRGGLPKVPAVETRPVAEICSDADILAEMKAQLAQEVWVSNRGIWVDARDGTIALVGVVNSEDEKAALTSIARGVEGMQRG